MIRPRRSATAIAAAMLMIAFSPLAASPANASATIPYGAVKAAVTTLYLRSNPLLTTQCAPSNTCVVHYSRDAYGLERCAARAGCYAFEECGGFPFSFLPRGSDERDVSYALIADVVLTYQHDLTELGYPRSVWGSTIDAFESYEVRRASRSPSGVVASSREDRYATGTGVYHGYDWDGLYQALQERVAFYRASHAGLKGIVQGGGCGGSPAGTELRIAASPASAQIFVIPTFYYEVCRAERINPENLDACDHWREVLGGTIDGVEGEYHYIVRWVGGAVRRGVLDADQFSTEVPPKTVTLQKP